MKHLSLSYRKSLSVFSVSVLVSFPTVDIYIKAGFCKNHWSRKK